MHVAPIEHNFGIRRLVCRTDQPAIGGGQTHHVAQPIFGPIEIVECCFQVTPKQEVLGTRLGFLIGFAAAGADFIFGVDFFPSLQCGIAAATGGF